MRPTYTVPPPGYDVIVNYSDAHTMIATLRIPGIKAMTHVIPPLGKLVTVGRVQWNLWTLRWREKKLSDYS